MTLVTTHDQLKETLRETEHHLAGAQKNILELNDVIRVKDAEIRNRDDCVRILKEKVAQMTATCEDQVNAINRFKLDQDALCAQLREKNCEIKKLTDRVQEVNAWNAKLNGDI